MPEPLCLCGCGEVPPTYPKTDRSRGWVRGEPRPFVPYHHHRQSPVEYVEDERGCWIWQRFVGTHGYGVGYDEGGQRLAHRIYYEREHGSIPTGLHVDHLCGVKVCVNPAHLEAVTQAENNQRSWDRRRFKVDGRIVWDPHA